MANSFSDALALNPTDVYNASYKRPGNLTHARLRKKRANMNWTAAGVGVAANDTAVIGTFKSSDRFYDLRLSQNAAMGAGSAISLGLYRAAIDHVPVTGNLIRATLFANAMSLAGPFARLDIFTNSTQLRNIDRGLALWQLVNIAVPGTYTKDPMIDMDLVATVTTALAATLQTQTYEVDYVSFG